MLIKFLKKCNLLRPLSLFNATLLFTGLGIYATAVTAPFKVMPADLAIVLPAQRDLRIAAQDVVAPLKGSLLPRELLGQVEAAYRSTPVGDALETENTYSDWTLVSLRIAPCAPLGMIPSIDTQVFCWPEVRLVWQPILKDFRRYAVILSAFADDRAIHALYDFSAKLALPAAEVARAQQLLEKISRAMKENPTQPAKELSVEEITEFVRLRDKTSDALVSKALALRTGQLSDSAYEKINERPEFNNAVNAQQFVARLKNFIAEVAHAESIKEMTSFSLPEGREPPQSDDWIFLQFLREKGTLVQQQIKLHSAQDGRTLFDFGPAPRASQMRDDPLLHDALETMNERDAKEIRQRVLLSPMEVALKKNIVSDRNLTLVPNTSCASCHKFNSLRFDFHAFSYLEDRTITVSPRVRTDVVRDLEWLEKRTGR
ncbi:MAG: hypothetical protein RL189_50 [Pseudomonadota bacterium]